MKTTKINLLVNRNEYKAKAKYFKILRQVTLIYTFVAAIVIFIFFALNTTTLVQTNKLTNEKKQYLGVIQQQSADEGKLLYITKKVNLLDTYLTDDAKFEPYYNLLVESLGESTESAKLSSFLIDKERNADFQMSFTSLSEMVTFLSFVESEDFVSSFHALSLANFKSTAGKEDVQTYELSFKGIFNKINE